MRILITFSRSVMLLRCGNQEERGVDPGTPYAQTNELAVTPKVAASDFAPDVFVINDNEALIKFEEDMSYSAIDAEAVSSGGASTQLTPELASRHKLTFASDGRLQLQLDCNRGNSTWSASVASNGTGTLKIGDIASTRALCPEPTYGEEMASKLPTARSYTLSADKDSLGIQVGDTFFVFARDAAP